MRIMFNPVRLHPELRQIASNPIHIKVEFTFLFFLADFLHAASSFYDNFYDIQQSKSIIFVSFMMIFLLDIFSFSCQMGGLD